MSGLRTILGIHAGGPPPDRREVRAQIEEEIAFHLEERASEIARTEGVSPRVADELARARFGDETKIKQRCERIAMWETTMLQRINAVLSVLLLVGLVSVGWVAYTSNARTSAELAGVSQALAALREDFASGTRRSAAEANRVGSGAEIEEGFIYVSGEGIERPGVYSMPPTGIDLKKQLIASGMTDWTAPLTVTVSRTNEHGENMVVYRGSVEEVFRPKARFMLKGDDTVNIERTEVRTINTSSNSIYITGDVLSPGAQTLPSRGLTVSKAILAAGGIADGERDRGGPLVSVRRGPEGSSTIVYRELYPLLMSAKTPFVLEADDQIIVSHRYDSELRIASPGNEWHGTVTVRGAVELPGKWSLRTRGVAYLPSVLTAAGLYRCEDERIEIDVVRGEEVYEFVHEPDESGHWRQPTFLVLPGDEIRVYEHGRDRGEADLTSAATTFVGEGFQSWYWFHFDSPPSLEELIERAGGFPEDEAVDESVWIVSISRSRPADPRNLGATASDRELFRLPLDIALSQGDRLRVEPREKVSLTKRRDGDDTLVLIAPTGRALWPESESITVVTREKNAPEHRWHTIPGPGHEDHIPETFSNKVVRRFSIGVFGNSRTEQRVTIERAAGGRDELDVNVARLFNNQLFSDIAPLQPGDTIIFEEL